ncbi:MAG: hypothetical protein WCW13_03830 [archaeon]|jgi:hypothetical protein
MFKKALILVLVLLLASTVFSIRLIDPLSKDLSLNKTNFIGTVAVGNTIELIFSKELVDKYESIDVVTPLPTGFNYEARVEMEALKLFIHVPMSANPGNYPFSVKLAGSNREDTVPLAFDVLKNALNVSPVDISESTTLVGSVASFKFFFVNNTDSDAVFDISTSLPNNWMNKSPLDMGSFSKRVIVPRRGTLTDTINVYPRLQGKKEFAVTVAYEDTSKDFSFVVNANPTLKSKFESVIYGLPFYSFSLLPSYFVNGLFSLIIN